MHAPCGLGCASGKVENNHQFIRSQVSPKFTKFNFSLRVKPNIRTLPLVRKDAKAECLEFIYMLWKGYAMDTITFLCFLVTPLIQSSVNT